MLSPVLHFRASSRGSRTQDQTDQFRENTINVYLQDVQHLVRRAIVGLPGENWSGSDVVLTTSCYRRVHQVRTPTSHLPSQGRVLQCERGGPPSSPEILHISCAEG